LSGALDGDIEARNERGQAQPVEDADAEIQDSHGTDSRRESPGPILDLASWACMCTLPPLSRASG
jgi:hypothetical protein